MMLVTIAVADSHDLEFGSACRPLPLDDIAYLGAHHCSRERRCPADAVRGDISLVIADNMKHSACIGFADDRDRCAEMHFITRLRCGIHDLRALDLCAVVANIALGLEQLLL